jgi:hypothetical protein
MVLVEHVDYASMPQEHSPYESQGSCRRDQACSEDSKPQPISLSGDYVYLRQHRGYKLPSALMPRSSTSQQCAGRQFKTMATVKIRLTRFGKKAEYSVRWKVGARDADS